MVIASIVTEIPVATCDVGIVTLKPVPVDVASPALINSSISPSWFAVFALILIIAPVVKLVELISTNAAAVVIVLFITDKEAALVASIDVTAPQLIPAFVPLASSSLLIVAFFKNVKPSSSLS